MELEKKILRGAVIEGYTILMRADAELLLPKEKKKMEEFYISLSEKCMTWATEVRGERLRELFSSLESVAEKAHFKTRQYQLRMRSPWQRMPYIAMVCESHLKEDGDFKDSYRRVSHVWNAEEETMLPMDQILKMFCVKNDSKTLGFHPDGVYPENDAIVFYKNEGKNNDFMEVRRNFGKA